MSDETMFKIETGIEIPGRLHKKNEQLERKFKMTMEKMDKKSSFFIPSSEGSSATIKKIVSRVEENMNNTILDVSARKSNPFSFSVRSMKNENGEAVGYRIWRIN